MNDLVCLQCTFRFSRKGASFDITLVRALVCVRQHMNLEQLLRTRRVIAIRDGTLVLRIDIVNEHMDLVVALVVRLEIATRHGTLKELISRVRLQVLFQFPSSFRRKAAIRKWTLERTFT